MPNPNQHQQRRVLTPEGGRVPAEELSPPVRNLNPENDIGPGGAVGGGVMRGRDENALSFRHFLQPHSDVVPQPPPTRGGGGRRGVDLVDVTMALPDFVQDHLVLESLSLALASGGGDTDTEPSQDISPTRPHQHQHPFDLGDMLPSQRQSSTHRNIPRAPNTRRTGGGANGGDYIAEHDAGQGCITLPDFLSDGPMHLNHDPGVLLSSQSSSCSSRVGAVGGGRARIPVGDNLEEPVRDPMMYDSKDALRLEVERLRTEVMDKARRNSQLETELNIQRNISTTLEISLRTAERSLVDSIKKATEAEKRLALISNSALANGHLPSASASSSTNNASHACNGESGLSSFLNVATTSERLLSQLLQNMQDMKRMALENGGDGDAPVLSFSSSSENNASSGDQRKGEKSTKEKGSSNSRQK